MSFTWDISPEIFKLGPLSLRYYGLLFVFVFLGGFYLFRWQMARVGWKEEDIEDFIIPGMLAVVIGARLGHVVFYEPGFYFSHPAEIIKFWKGGLASHGATIGLIIAIFWYAYKKGMAVMEVADRFSFSAALGSSLVRIGNFFNSEIVGRVTDQTWGVRFPRCVEDRGHKIIPLRHPSQIYEALMGAAILLILYLVDRKYKEKRPRGLLMSLFLALYFTARFIVEFFKEYQTGLKNDHFLTMGQYLSIPLALAGYVMIYVSVKANKPSVSKDPLEAHKTEKTEKTHKKSKKHKRK